MGKNMGYKNIRDVGKKVGYADGKKGGISELLILWEKTWDKR